jgi:hypothetical protein
LVTADPVGKQAQLHVPMRGLEAIASYPSCPVAGAYSFTS